MPLGKGQKTQVNVEAVINVTGQENIRKTSQQLGQLTKQFAESKLKINWNKTGFNNVVNDVKDLTKWVNTLGLSLSRVNDIITISGKDIKGTFFSSSYKLDPSKFEKGAWENRGKTSAFTEISNSAYIKQADAISNLRTAYSQLNQQISKMKSVKRELGEDSKAYQKAKDSVEEYKTAVKDAREFIANNFAGERLDSETGLLIGDSEAARTDRKLNHELQYIETLNKEQAEHRENTQRVNEYVSALKTQFKEEEKLVRLQEAKAPEKVIQAQRAVVTEATRQTNALKQQVKGTKEYNEVKDKVTLAEKRHQQALSQLTNTAQKSVGIFGQFKQTLKQVVSAGLSWKIFSAIMQTLTSTTEVVIELDKSLVDLQIATGSTRQEAEQLLQTYNGMAKSLGATTSEVASAADAWLRQGYTTAQTNELIRSSMVLSKIGQIESAEATQYLTSALKGFNIEAEKSIEVVDKFAAIDLVSATSASGLAEALSRTAASADMAGVEMEQLLGYVAVVGETTQKSMSSVGESFKTIFARFGNIKAGKFVDDETGESLNDVAKVLADFNIQLYDAQGNMNNVGDILDTLGDKWDSLTEVEQNALATAIAGTKQRENFIVLMENYETAIEYANKALNSSGTAMEKYDAYLNSIEASQAKLKATFEEFSQTLVDKGIIKGFYDMATAGVQLLTNITKLIPLLKTMAVILSGMLSGKVIIKLLDSIRSGNGLLNGLSKVLKENISNLKFYISNLKSSEEALITQAQAISLAKGRLLAYQIAATAVISIITLLVSAYQKYKQGLEETADKAKQARQEAEEQKKTISALAEEYDKLQENKESGSSLERIAEIEKELNDYINKINKKETDKIKLLELQNGLYTDQKKIIDQIVAKSNEDLVIESKKEKVAQQKLLLEETSGKKALKFYVNASDTVYKDGLKGILGEEDYNSIISAFGEGVAGDYGQSLTFKFSDNADEIAQQFETLIQIRDKYLETYSEEELLNNTIYQQINNTITKYEDLINKYKESRDAYWSSEINKKIYSDQKDAEFKINSSEDLEAYIETLKDWAETQNSGKEISEDYATAIENAVYAAFPEFVKKIKEANGNVTEFNQVLEDTKKKTEETKNAYDSITSALDEYNNSGSISYDTYMSLLDLGSEYVELLFDENGALVNNGNTIQSLMQIKLRQYAIEKALAYLNHVAANGVNSLSKSLEEEANATNVLTQAQITQAQIALLQIKGENERRIAAERFVAMVNSVNKVSLGNTSATNSNSKAKERAKEIQDQYNSALEYAKTVLDEEIEKLEEEKEAIEERNEALQEELDIYDKALAYINKYISGKIDALEKEKQALQEKNDEQEREIELEELRNNINKNHQRTMRTYSEDQGWTWVVDPEDIKETEDAIKEYNKKVAEYEKEDEIAKIEEQIEAWEEYLAKWEEVPDVYEEMEAKIAFESLSAYVTEKDLLNKRTNAIDKFKKSYVKKQKEISKNTTEEVDKQIEKLQDIKEKWDSIPSDYETASNKLNAEMLLGKDAREKILSGETGVIQNFASAYAVAMKNAEKAAKEGASGISSALSNISLPEITINDILGKGIGIEEVDMTIGKNAQIKGDTLYNPFTKRYYYLEDMKKNKDGTYTAKAGTLYVTTAYASGTLSANAGLANVDEKGNELIVPKQGRYRMMEYGDTVVPHNLSQRLFDVATNPLKFIANAINSIKSPILNEFGGNNNTTTISIGNITMPQSINNADKFVKELQLIAANR